MNNVRCRRICDVETSNAEWRAEFYISENTQINGEKVSGIENLFRYKNVEVSVGSGEYTQISNSLHQGRVRENGNDDYKSFVLNVLSASVGWWDTAVSIYNAIAALVGNTAPAPIALNSGVSIIYSSVTRAVGTCVSYEKGEFFNNAYTANGNYVEDVHSDSSNAHYLIFIANVHSRLDATIQEILETGYIEFKWDVFLNSTLEDVATNVRKTYTKVYTNMH